MVLLLAGRGDNVEVLLLPLSDDSKSSAIVGACCLPTCTRCWKRTVLTRGVSVVRVSSASGGWVCARVGIAGD